MTTSSPRLVVVGQCAYTAMVVRRLIREGVHPASVVVSTASADYDPFRGLEVQGPSRWFAAHRYYHGGWREDLRSTCRTARVRLIEVADVFGAPLDADVLLVAGLAHRVPDEVLSQFGPAALNVHTSLLPEFKGPQPEAQVILHSARRSGVSIHTLTRRFDDGPVLYQAEYSVPHDSTVGSLEQRGAVLAARGMADLLTIPVASWPVVQLHRSPSYFRWYDDNLLDLSRTTSAEGVQCLLRLRPEAYAYFEMAGTIVFPIEIDHKMKRGGLALRWAGSTLRVLECVKSVRTVGREVSLAHYQLS